MAAAPWRRGRGQCHRAHRSPGPGLALSGLDARAWHRIALRRKACRASAAGALRGSWRQAGAGAPTTPGGASGVSLPVPPPGGHGAPLYGRAGGPPRAQPGSAGPRVGHELAWRLPRVGAARGPSLVPVAPPRERPLPGRSVDARAPTGSTVWSPSRPGCRLIARRCRQVAIRGVGLAPPLGVRVPPPVRRVAARARAVGEDPPRPGPEPAAVCDVGGGLATGHGSPTQTRRDLADAPVRRMSIFVAPRSPSALGIPRTGNFVWSR
jgi:hypothetical protein